MQSSFLNPSALIALTFALVAAGCGTVTGGAYTGPGPSAGHKVDDGMARDTTNVYVQDLGGEKAAAAPATPQPATTAQPAPAPQPAGPKTVRISDAPPPDAKPGECYTKLLLPAEYENKPEQAEIHPGYDKVTYTEPEYQDVEERVVVKPASKQVEIVPAEYAEVTEKVQVREAYRREIEVPVLYDTSYEQVMERPARQVWKPGRGATERVDMVTGEILCLVEEPAVYKTVEHKELKRPASKRYEDVPAEFATIKKMKLVKPQSTREIEIPAEYTTVKVRKLVKPSQEVRTPVAPEYGVVEKQVMVQPERAEWVQVLCDQNTTPAKITEVKRALSARGYQVSTDANIDESLTNAVRQFQTDQGLRPTGLMTVKTIQALGVGLN